MSNHHFISPGVTPGIRHIGERWALGIVTIGWVWLAVSTIQDPTRFPFLSDNPYWWMGALASALITMIFFLFGTSQLRRLAAATTIVYGASRGLSYLVQGIQGPMAVWIIVVGLTLVGYRASVRSGGL